jgi:hypothetical protein
MKKKKITKVIRQNILADVDDEIWLLKKRIELKYTLTWADARDLVNDSIKELYKYEITK